MVEMNVEKNEDFFIFIFVEICFGAKVSKPPMIGNFANFHIFENGELNLYI